VGAKQLRDLFELLQATLDAFATDNASRLGAAVAYYAVFSVAPLLVIVIAVAGLIFGREGVQGQVVAQIGGVVGEPSAELIGTMLARASDQSTGIIATVLGTGTLFLGASGVFLELRSALNTIWGVQARPARAIAMVLKERLLLFALVLAAGFLVIVSLMISAGLAAMTAFFEPLLPAPKLVLHALDTAVSLAVLAGLFALVFKGMPDAEIGWKDVWLGGLVTAILFTVGKLAIGLYLGQTALASSYGAAGALVLILVWVYYSSQILFFGAEFTKVYANRHGSRLRPAPDHGPPPESVCARR